MITGKITSKSNPNDIQNINIGLSIPGKTFAFKVVKTDKNGNFIFNLDKPYYNSSISIQVIDDKRSNYTVELDTPSGIDYSKLNFQTNINLTPALTETLLDRSIASQIENAYYSTKTDSILKTKSIDAFYEPIAKEYILDDYTRFPTLKETAIEIVKEMYYEQKDKTTIFHFPYWSPPSKFPRFSDSIGHAHAAPPIPFLAAWSICTGLWHLLRLRGTWQ